MDHLAESSNERYRAIVTSTEHTRGASQTRATSRSPTRGTSRLARPHTSIRTRTSLDTQPHTTASTHIGLVSLEKLRYNLELSCIVDRLSYDLEIPRGQKQSVALRNSKQLNKNEYTRMFKCAQST